MEIFAEKRLNDFLDGRTKALGKEVRSQDKNYLLNVNETKFIDYLVNKYRIEPLIIHLDKMKVSDREEFIPAEMFPSGFHVRAGVSYPKQVITYHLEFSGEHELFECQPSSYLVWTSDVKIESNYVSFEIINWRDNAETIIKSEANNIIRNIQLLAENIDKEVSDFNNGLDRTARQILQSRKAHILKQLNLLSSLGVPLKKAESVPSTFSIPVTKKEIVIKKPESPSKPFSPEPALDENVYQAIIDIIYETGVEIERHPNLYNGKDEETLRDHFIMVLSPHFQSTTGETFNKTGKTDILIRHEKQNIFVAECKFWGGIKAFYQTIDQLLSYLTWRDSKSAIVCFVKNKELNPVLEAIENETPKHPCFVKFFGRKTEGLFNFEFHLKDDPTRSVKLVIICFHFPGSQ
jgi:hypothetical protein